MTDKITMAGDTQAEIAAMREGADALGRIAASLWGDTAKAHKKAQAAILTAAADRMEREAGLPTRDELAAGLCWYAGEKNYRSFYDEDGEESIPCIPCDFTAADEEGLRSSFYDCGERARALLARMEQKP